MFTRKNKARWACIRQIRREVRIYTPNDPSLSILPQTIRDSINSRFLEMQKRSSVGTYNSQENNIRIIDKSIDTKRHELVHAINNYASLYPSCSRFFPPPVRLVGWITRQKSKHLQALGFIANETLAQWVEGSRKFFFNPDGYYIAQAAGYSKPVAYLWIFTPPVLLVLSGLLSGIFIVRLTHFFIGG